MVIEMRQLNISIEDKDYYTLQEMSLDKSKELGKHVGISEFVREAIALYLHPLEESV